jgi:hypothetical protein
MNVAKLSVAAHRDTVLQPHTFSSLLEMGAALPDVAIEAYCSR